MSEVTHRKTYVDSVVDEHSIHLSHIGLIRMQFLFPGLSGRRGIVASVCPSGQPFVFRLTLPCPNDNTSQIRAEITKFTPSMYHGILSAGIETRVIAYDRQGHIVHFVSAF